MRLKQLEMVAFGPFLDRTVLEFSVDDKRHITIVHGENGAGKTSILNAILWCLTGTVSPSLRRELEKTGKASNSLGLMFQSGLDNGPEPTGSCEVSVTFIFRDKEYLARRISDEKTLSGKFFLAQKVSGILEDFSDPEGVIERIFPAGVANYFMFDGEGFKSDGSGETGFESSVKRVLGFNFANDALDKLQALKDSLEKELRGLQAKDIKDQSAREEYEEALEALSNAQATAKSAAANRDSAHAQVLAISEEIGKLDSEDIRQTQRQFDQVRQELASLNPKLNNAGLNRQKLIQKHFKSVFGKRLYDSGFEFINDNRSKGVIPAPYNDQFINDLLEKKECICGRCIEIEQIKILESKLKTATTALLTDRLAKAQAVTAADKNGFESFKLDYLNANVEIRDIEQAIRLKQDALEDLDSKLQSFAGLDEQLEDLRSTQKAFIEAERRCQKELEDAEDTIKREQYKVNKYKPPKNYTASIEQERLALRIKKLEGLLKAGRVYLNRELDSARDFIRTSMSDQIARTAVEHEVRLNDDFTSRYVNTGGDNVVSSQGQRKTLEFAFLCSLVALIKEWKASQNGILVPGTLAPLVVDAPFSQVDQDNQKIIGDMLLGASEQLIFLLINDQWANLELLVSSNMGKEYLLTKNMVADQHNRPEKREFFRGKEYLCAHYNAEYNHTSVEEIK